MKKLLITFIYKFIELLPPRLAEKIKIIGCVIFGDWHFIMPRHANILLKEFPNCSSEKVREVYKDLADEEVGTILRYLQKIEEFSHFPYPEKGLLFNYRNIMGEEYREYIRMQKIMRSEVKKFALKLPGHELLNEEVLYFHHGLRDVSDGIKEYIKGKTFIDAGAFVGDSALIFQEYYCPGKICSFEPSEINRKHYVSFMKKNHIPDSSYMLYPYGLGARDEVVSFYDSGTCGCSLKNTKESKNSTITVKTLDHLFFDTEEKIGIIKADVEGMGLELVKGAEKIIKRDLPVLSLSIYHSEEELLGVYSYLKALKLDYEYHVLSLTLSYTTMELTLLAFPKNKE